MPRDEKQKLKILYVAKFFLEHSDADHYVSASDIIDYLQEEHDITASRQSIYRDIAALRDDYGMDIDDTGRGGRYRLLSREFDYEDLFILAQCIYSTRFISQAKADELVEKLRAFCSTYQGDKLQSETYYPERVRATKKDVLGNVALLNEELPKRKKRSLYSPKKVTFKYLRHDISDVTKEVEKHSGKTYKVCPQALLINDGFYYLLAEEDESGEMRTYRVDRMKGIKVTTEENHVWLSKKDLTRYSESVFSMFGGEEKHVTLLCEEGLLDTMIDRFGTKGVTYLKEKDGFFTVSVDLEVSGTFFAWLCQFGTRAKILYPKEVAEQYKKHLSDIVQKYEAI